MLGLNGRSIDDLLGPAADDPRAGSQPRRDGWLREWPLLAGLTCSLGLIGGAMLVDAPEAPPVAVAKADSAAGDYSAGDVVDVGEDETAADAAPPAGAAAEPANRKAKKPKKQAPATSDPPSTVASDPAGPTGGSGSGSSTGSGGRTRSRTPRTPASGGPSGPSGPSGPAKIVNVTGTSASIRNGPLAYSLSAPTHSPRVGTPWRLTVTATRNGKPLAGKVKVDVLHNGAVVGHVADGALRGGRFAHDFDWPTESVGHPLTVKATVSGAGLQQSFLFDVKVKAGG